MSIVNRLEMWVRQNQPNLRRDGIVVHDHLAKADGPSRSKAGIGLENDAVLATYTVWQHMTKSRGRVYLTELLVMTKSNNETVLMKDSEPEGIAAVDADLDEVVAKM